MIDNSKSATVYKSTLQCQKFIQYNHAELKIIILLSTLNNVFITTTIRFLLLLTGLHLGNVIITKCELNQ